MWSICTNKWNKVFKNGRNKNCGMQPLKNLKAYSLLKQKVKSQFSKFRLRQYLFVFKEFCREMRLSNIFKTTSVTKLTKPILESCYRVLLNVTSKGKPLKQHVYFFEDRWNLAYFWHSNRHNFGYIWEKFLESPQESLKTRKNSYQ